MWEGGLALACFCLMRAAFASKLLSSRLLAVPAVRYCNPSPVPRSSHHTKCPPPTPLHPNPNLPCPHPQVENLLKLKYVLYDPASTQFRKIVDDKGDDLGEWIIQWEGLCVRACVCVR